MTRIKKSDKKPAKHHNQQNPSTKAAAGKNGVSLLPPQSEPVTPLPLQTKLTINQPGDAYEREADEMVDEVMRMPALALQRQCACGGIAGDDGECADCKAKRLVIQRQTMFTPSTQLPSRQAPPSVHQTLQSSGKPLDGHTRSFMETRFGQDFSHVRVHTNSQAAHSAADINATAYTVGRDVVFGAGQYNPETRDGQTLLAHELTHTIQQGTSKSSQTLQRQSDPRHQRGYAGEQNMGFILYRREDGWATIRGPSGSAGHNVTTGGEDGLFYNVRTKQLHITDNKSLAKRGNVTSATAIDPSVNLQQNVRSMIRSVSGMSSDQLPMRQDVLRLLRQTNAALRNNQPLPGRVQLIVSNAGGRSTGITQRLRNLGVRFMDVNQPVTRPSGTARPSLQGGVPSRTTSDTTKPRSRNQSARTNQTRALTRPASPPAPVGAPSARGVAKVNALQLAVDAMNYILGIFAERHQANRAQQALNKVMPQIEDHLRRHPTDGALIRYNYAQNKQGGTARFLAISYGYGPTLSEAQQDLLHRDSPARVMRNRPNQRYEHATHTDQWVRPKRRINVLSLKTPFPAIRRGIFAVNENRLQGVSWNGYWEFNDTSEASLGSLSFSAKFRILQPPSQITWFNGQSPYTSTINIVTRRSANGVALRAIDLDPINPFGNVAVVPIFPADRQTQRLFNRYRATRDNLGQLRQFANIDQMRWVRPEHILIQ